MPDPLPPSDASPPEPNPRGAEFAHHFNDLLTVILGNVAVAGVHVAAGSPVARALLEIQTAAQRAAALVRELATEPAVKPPAPAAFALTQHARTVLVVDDEPHVRELIGALLSADGYSVELAADGREAIGKFAARPDQFELAVVDLMMPQMNGSDLLRALRELRPGLPAVVASGYTDTVLPADIRDGGPTTVLPKPFRIEQLSAVVKALIAQK